MRHDEVWGACGASSRPVFSSLQWAVLSLQSSVSNEWQSGSSYRVMGTERGLNNIVCSHSDFPWFTALVACCFVFILNFFADVFFIGSAILKWQIVAFYWVFSLEASQKIWKKLLRMIVIFQSWEKNWWEILILKITLFTA